MFSHLLVSINTYGYMLIYTHIQYYSYIYVYIYTYLGLYYENLPDGGRSILPKGAYTYI
jgi:hypothetical protein